MKLEEYLLSGTATTGRNCPVPGCRQWRALGFFFVHVPVGEIKHLVKRLAVGKFRHADTEAHRKVIKIARLIPVVQEGVNPIHYDGGAGCVGIRQCDQEFVASVTTGINRAILMTLR